MNELHFIALFIGISIAIFTLCMTWCSFRVKETEKAIDILQWQLRQMTEQIERYQYEIAAINIQLEQIEHHLDDGHNDVVIARAPEEQPAPIQNHPLDFFELR